MPELITDFTDSLSYWLDKVLDNPYVSGSIDIASTAIQTLIGMYCLYQTLTTDTAQKSIFFATLAIFIAINQCAREIKQAIRK